MITDDVHGFNPRLSNLRHAGNKDIQPNEELLARRIDFAHNPNPAAELQKICSGITHLSTIVHTAGISKSIQNQNDSKWPQLDF
jgi:hypothetical protein